MKVNFDRIKQDLKVVDITTGDSITPCAVEYAYKMLLNDMVIPIFSYNLESVLAEKFETILSRGIANTRMRDFYDIHILLNLNPDDIRYETFSRALNETARRSGTLSLIIDALQLVEEIKFDSEMENHWLRYQKKSPYAAEIGWSEVMESVESFAKLSVYV